MGVFCTTTSIQALMVDTGWTAGSAQSTLLEACLSDAESAIKTCLSSRYDLSSDYFQTSTSTPPEVSRICKWMTMGYFYLHNSRGGKDSFNRSREYLKMAEDKLKAISERKINLYDSEGRLIPELTTLNKSHSNTLDYHETFSEDHDLKWKVDPDKIDDLEDERD